MTKGNRTTKNRNATKITNYSQRLSEDVEGYKAFADARRQQRIYNQEDVGMFIDRIESYFDNMEDIEKPYTVSGLILAMKIPQDAFYRMKSGEYDYRLWQYIDEHQVTEEEVLTDDEGLQYAIVDEEKVILIPYSEIIKKAMLVIQAQIETRLYERGRVGDIFALKCRFGWSEEKPPSEVNQTLVIGGEEEAKHILELLK